MSNNDTPNKTTNNKDDGNEGYMKFCKAIEGHSKDVSAILRCHLLAEYFIDQIIITYLKRGDIILNEGNFSFANKIFIVKSFDVVGDEIITAIKHLNTVRNRCSHQMEYTVTEIDVDLIGSSMGKEYSKIKKESKDVNELLRKTLIIILAPLEGTHSGLLNADSLIYKK